jgi:hypothetical protein
MVDIAMQHLYSNCVIVYTAAGTALIKKVPEHREARWG